MTDNSRRFLFPALWGVCLVMLFLVLDSQPGQGVPVQRSLSIEEEYMERNITEEDLEIRFEWLKKNAKKILETVGAASANIPTVGPFLPAAFQLAAILIPEADKIDGIRSEMNALNARLDFFNEELKWAYSHYQIALDHIENSWLKYSEMANNKNMLEKIFFPSYTPFVDSAMVIHRLLESDPVAHTPTSTTQTLGDVLAKRFRCHEKDVEDQFTYLIVLLRMGNLMDEKYYEFKGIPYDFRKNISGIIESKSAKAMFKTQQRCVSNSKLYVKRDIIERIDDTKNHQQIANAIGEFLRRTYERYDWVVVAFTSHFSRNLFQVLKRHVFSGFTEIDRGTVTVAVASQIKGKYTKAKNLKLQIENCLKDVPCFAIEEEIQWCDKVSNAYTAIHIFKNHNQTYIGVDDDENNDTYSESFGNFEGNQSQIYSGKCSITNTKYTARKLWKNPETDTIDHGSNRGRGFLKSLKRMLKKPFEKVKGIGYRKFIILIKSDEEMDGAHNPCKTLECKNKGKCVVARGTKIPMCECEYPYHGKTCEENYQSIDLHRLCSDGRQLPGPATQQPNSWMWDNLWKWFCSVLRQRE